MGPRRRSRLPALAATLAVVACAHAASAGERVALDLAQAIRIGAERGPLVAPSLASREALAEARRAADATLSYAPRLGLSGGFRRIPGDSGAVVGATLSTDLATASLGSARARLGDALVAHGRVEVARARLDAAAEAALAFIDLVEARDVKALRAAALAETKGLVALVETRARAGVAMPSEVALARGEAGAAEAAMLDAEGLLTEATYAVRHALALPADAEIEAVGTPAFDAPPSLSADARETPAVVSASARAEVARAEERLVTSHASPPLGVGVGYQHDGTGERLWMAQLSLPLPLATPGAFDSARQRAAADAAAAGVAFVAARAEHDLRVALHEREHRREVLAALEGGSLDALREAARLSRAQLAAGTHDATLVFVTRARLLVVEELVARARADVARADCRVAHLRGTLVGP